MLQFHNYNQSKNAFYQEMQKAFCVSQILACYKAPVKYIVYEHLQGMRKFSLRVIITISALHTTSCFYISWLFRKIQVDMLTDFYTGSRYKSQSVSHVHSFISCLLTFLHMFVAFLLMEIVIKACGIQVRIVIYLKVLL